MSHEIFISYAKGDRATADAVCSALEKAGVGCWIAPRDIAPGDIYSESIIRAITGSQLIILVFSSHANESPHVLAEVDRAYNKRKSIVRLNVENVDLSERFEYYLSTAQWLDAFAPLKQSDLQTLTAVVQSKLGSSLSPPPSQVRKKTPALKTAATKARATSVVKPARTKLSPPARPPRPRPAVTGTGRGYIVGRVNHYYGNLGVAGVDVLDTFQLGDTVRIVGPATDFEQKVRSIQLNRVAVERITGNNKIGLKVSQTVSIGDEIFKVVFRSSDQTSSTVAVVKESRVGEVQHYYGRAGAAVIHLSKPLKLNDLIRIRGHKTDFTQTVSSLELDRAPVTRAKSGSLVGIGVADAVRVGDFVYILTDKT